MDIEAELHAVEECQRGNRYPLSELLQTISPMLRLFICRALEGKKPFRTNLGNLISVRVQLRRDESPEIKKEAIYEEVAQHFNCKRSYVRRCYERARKKEREWLGNFTASLVGEGMSLAEAINHVSERHSTPPAEVQKAYQMFLRHSKP
jgi:hypothetical protein